MPDLEKVINGLREMSCRCTWKDIDRIRDKFQPIVNGAIELLKEQEAVVRCKDCKHRPKEPDWETYESGFDIEFPEGSKCPCQCSGDEYYSWYPEDDWFCADGERA